MKLANEKICAYSRPLHPIKMTLFLIGKCGTMRLFCVLSLGFKRGSSCFCDARDEGTTLTCVEMRDVHCGQISADAPLLLSCVEAIA